MKIISGVCRFMYETLFVSVNFSFGIPLFEQDHSVLPAGLLVLQRVPAVSGMCAPAEVAPPVPALHHLCPPPSNLPEAAVGPPETPRSQCQQVSVQKN